MKFNLKHGFILPLAAAALLAGGCDDDDDDTDTDMDPSTADDGGTRDGGRLDGGNLEAGAGDGGALDGGAGDGGGDQDAGMLSDGQIAAVVTAANTGEVEQGNAALSKVQTQPVRDFAMMMVTMHTAAQARAMMVVSSAGITPMENQVSMRLSQESDAIVAQIQAAQPNQADLVYMQSQVAVHRRVLSLIDNVLLPNADTAALRADLMTARGEVASHLELAQDRLDELEN